MEGKNQVLMYKVVIVFTMEIMHKYLVNNFTCYLCTMIINQIMVKLDKVVAIGGSGKTQDFLLCILNTKK